MATVPIGGVLFACCAFLAVKPIRRPRSFAVAKPAEPSDPQRAAVRVRRHRRRLERTASSSTATSTSPAMPSSPARSVLVDSRRSRRGDAEITGSACGARPAARRGPRSGLVLHYRAAGVRTIAMPRPLAPDPLRPVAGATSRGRPRTRHQLWRTCRQSSRRFRHRSRPERSPTLVNLHGGRFRWGKKNFEARADSSPRGNVDGPASPPTTPARGLPARAFRRTSSMSRR